MYLVLNCRGPRGAVVKDLDKKGSGGVHVRGNIPPLCAGMIVSLGFDGDGTTVSSCRINMSMKRNRDAVIKSGMDPCAYEEGINRYSAFSKYGLSWEASCKSGKKLWDYVYKELPFCRADALHKEIENKSEDPVRIKAINTEVIRRGRLKRKIEYSLEEYLSMFDDAEKDGAYERLLYAVKILSLGGRDVSIVNGHVVDDELKRKETSLRNLMEKKAGRREPFLEEADIESYLRSAADLDRCQRDALACLKDAAPCIITGGPGTGKTTVISGIAECCRRTFGRDGIILAAPTGKASRRLAEKTGLPASTIHRALRKNPEDSYVFYGPDNPLPARLVVVDESSMIDTELMYDLVSALRPDAKIIFAGDACQLYPVSYGEPFFDFLKILPVYELKNNHRQQEGSAIISAAEGVLNGRWLSAGGGISIKRIRLEDAEKAVADDGGQIITPYNDVNAVINKILKKGPDRINCGDKVMTVTNTKDYCNGDIGRVIRADSQGFTVRTETGSFNISRAKAEEDLVPAYAITVHKMQGSEADNVTLFLPAGKSVEKRLLYTAVTRARKTLSIYCYS